MGVVVSAGTLTLALGSSCRGRRPPPMCWAPPPGLHGSRLSAAPRSLRPRGQFEFALLRAFQTPARAFLEARGEDHLPETHTPSPPVTYWTRTGACSSWGVPREPHTRRAAKFPKLPKKKRGAEKLNAAAEGAERA